LFKNYYPKQFPTLWDNFGELVEWGGIVSTREVWKEIQASPVEALRDWAEKNKALFPPPTAQEAIKVAQIYAVPHFQQNIEQKKLLNGGYVADPFVIAKAMELRGTVVTIERPKPHGTKIPNICMHFGIACLDLEQFMDREGWRF